MAHQVLIASGSMSSSESESFRSSSQSFVVVGDGSDDLTVVQDNDPDVNEDEDIFLIQNLTERVIELKKALAETQNNEKNTEEEKDHFRRKIQQLEEQIATTQLRLREQAQALEQKEEIELRLREQIHGLDQQVEESKNTTVMTSMSASMNPEALGTMVDQLTLENSELTKLLQEASSKAMVNVVKTKNKELKAKDEKISNLAKENNELKLFLEEEQQNASNERVRLLQQIEELKKSKQAPDDNLFNDMRAKEEHIKQLKAEKDDLEVLLQEEMENASKKEEQLQERIMELERARKSSPSTSTSSDLRAKEEELRQKEKRISALQEEKDELESLLLEEQENASQQREQLEARITELLKGVPSDNDQRCASLQQQIAEMKKVHEDQLTDLRSNHEVDTASLRQQIVEMTKRHEAQIANLQKNNEGSAPTQQQIEEMTKRHEEEMTALRQSHDDAMKEQQARAKTEINQLKRELSSFKRNASPEGAPNSDELDELRSMNERLENKLREYEINNNKLVKKKGDLLNEMRGLRAEKAKLEAELVISQRQMADRSSSSEETERLRERALKSESECDAHLTTIKELEDRINYMRLAAHENRSSSNRSSKDSDEYNQNLLLIYNSLSRISSSVARRKEERPERKNGRALVESILRLADSAARATLEQNDLIDLALKEKDFEKIKRREAENKCAEWKLRTAQQVQGAYHNAKQELAAQFAEHTSQQRQFIDFLQTRLELVTSPSFQQRVQPVPAYNGCSHFVGQPLPQP